MHLSYVRIRNAGPLSLLPALRQTLRMQGHGMFLPARLYAFVYYAGRQQTIQPDVIFYVQHLSIQFLGNTEKAAITIFLSHLV